MFDPPKTFFFGRGDEFSIDKQTRGGIAVISVEAEDVHWKDTKDRGQRTEDTGQDINAAATIPYRNLARNRATSPSRSLRRRSPSTC